MRITKWHEKNKNVKLRCCLQGRSATMMKKSKQEKGRCAVYAITTLASYDFWKGNVNAVESTLVLSSQRETTVHILYLFLSTLVPPLLMIIFIFIVRKETIDDIHTLVQIIRYSTDIPPRWKRWQTTHYFSSNLLRIWNQNVRSFSYSDSDLRLLCISQ